MVNALFNSYDIVICPVKSPQQVHLKTIRALNAKQTIGIVGCSVNAPRDGYLSTIDPASLFTDVFDVSQFDPWRQELYITLDFLKYLGCDVTDINDIKPEVWVSAFDRNLLESCQDTERRIIGIFPGGSFEQKSWRPENYEILARLFNDAHFVVFGGSDDAAIAQRVCSALIAGAPQARIQDLAGKTSLRELYKTIAACDVMLSMDTSGLHMAIAAGIPTVGIMGGWHYGRFAPWGDPKKHIFLTNELSCFHCSVPCKLGTYECIQGVTPDRVADAVSGLLHKRVNDH